MYLRVPLKGYYKGYFKGLYKGLEFPEIRDALFRGPYNKGPINLGYYIRIPYFRRILEDHGT